MDPAVDITALVKSYREIRALNSIDLAVNPGELFGVIGPDGAGKTTLFRILTTLVVPDSGEAKVLGYNPVADYKMVRRLLGYMPERFSLYQDLTVEENLRFFASIFGTTVEGNYHLIEDIYKMLEPFKKRRAGKLSGGMKQKLALSCAMIHKPELLILDEPTTGVDAVSRKEFWQILKKLKGIGITIIVSTPYMDEAILCDRVALMQDGEVMTIDAPGEIESRFPHRLVSVRSENMFSLLHDVEKIPGVISAYRFGSEIHISLPGSENELDESIRGKLAAAGHESLEWAETSPGIEDCFMELMKTEGQ
jgi:ABC-type multidrug transport system ATPase subunit